jgi:3',5'-cyclic AMP phosphodiesterase CpdA
MNRRSFLRLSAASLGTGALLQFTPANAALSHFARRNGEAPSPFSFVQLSDTHVGHPLGTSAFERAVDTINALEARPDFVLFTGDLTHDSDDAGEHAKRMKRFQEIAGRLRVRKRFHVPGEHDAALDGGTLFREHFGETHYSFDHRGVHFIGIDNVSEGKPLVGNEQIAWMRRDVARFPHTTPIVIFTHRPLFDLQPDWEWFTTDGNDVMNVLAPYDNVTILYGHIHRAHHHTSGNVRHHAARSLIFAFPDPATTEEKKAVPFDKEHPFRNLGIRQITAPALAVNDIELTAREFSGTEGIQQLRKGGSL